MDKRIQHLPADAAVLEQISVYPPHGGAGGRQDEGFLFFLLLPLDWLIWRSQLTIQQLCNAFRVGHTIEFLQKRNRPAALFFRVVVPVIAPHSDAVVADKPFFMTGWDQLFPTAKQEFFQVNFSGTALLVVCKMDVWNFLSPASLIFPPAFDILICQRG